MSENLNIRSTKLRCPECGEEIHFRIAITGTAHCERPYKGTPTWAGWASNKAFTKDSACSCDCGCKGIVADFIAEKVRRVKATTGMRFKLYPFPTEE